jgi:hypothetical protein
MGHERSRLSHSGLTQPVFPHGIVPQVLYVPGKTPAPLMERGFNRTVDDKASHLPDHYRGHQLRPLTGL